MAVIVNHVSRPRPGWYWRTLCKGGPRVPVLIAWRCPMDPFTGEPLDRTPVLLCWVGDDEADPYEQWSWVAGHPISRIDFDLMHAQAAWDRSYRPFSPGANPRLPVDLSQLDMPF